VGSDVSNPLQIHHIRGWLGGRIRVSLYDDSIKEILRIIWRDCWVASAKTQIRTIYKDVNGNAHAASAGYIYGDVDVDARMWYQESIETIKSTIDGMTATHASAPNPERVVKYMVIQGHRYQGNSLIDLRIKDINVKVDLNAEDSNAPEPAEPVEYDGTQNQSEGETAQTDVDLTEAIAEVICYWTGPWPLFHVEINQPIGHPDGQLTVRAHTAKNLLGVTEYSSCSVVGDDATPNPSFDSSLWAFLIDEVFSWPLIATLQFSCAYVESLIKSGSAVNPALAISAGAVMTAAALTAFFAPYLYTAHLVENGGGSNADAFWFLWSCGWNYIQIGFSLIAGSIVTALSSKLGGANVKAMKEFLNKALARFDPIAKIMFIGIMARMMTHYLHNHLKPYTQNVEYT
jgi:hypothetical protein